MRFSAILPVFLLLVSAAHADTTIGAGGAVVGGTNTSGAYGQVSVGNVGDKRTGGGHVYVDWSSGLTVRAGNESVAGSAVGAVTNAAGGVVNNATSSGPVGSLLNGTETGSTAQGATQAVTNTVNNTAQAVKVPLVGGELKGETHIGFLPLKSACSPYIGAGLAADAKAATVTGLPAVSALAMFVTGVLPENGLEASGKIEAGAACVNERLAIIATVFAGSTFRLPQLGSVFVPLGLSRDYGARARVDFRNNWSASVEGVVGEFGGPADTLGLIEDSYWQVSAQARKNLGQRFWIALDSQIGEQTIKSAGALLSNVAPLLPSQISSSVPTSVETHQVSGTVALEGGIRF